MFFDFFFFKVCDIISIYLYDIYIDIIWYCLKAILQTARKIFFDFFFLKNSLFLPYIFVLGIFSKIKVNSIATNYQLSLIGLEDETDTYFLPSQLK